jgi:hypothetical protein
MIISGPFGGFGQGSNGCPPCEAPSQAPGVDARLQFQRPSRAGFYTPRLLPTRFETHLRPFNPVMPAISANQARIPGYPQQSMRPDTVPGFPTPGAGGRVPPQRFTPGPAPGTAAIPGPSPAGPVAGFGRGGFGAASFGRFVTPGSPYTNMRTGMVTRFPTTGDDIRRGVRNVPTFIQRMTPTDYPYSHEPAGFFRKGAY